MVARVRDDFREPRLERTLEAIGQRHGYTRHAVAVAVGVGVAASDGHRSRMVKTALAVFERRDPGERSDPKWLPRRIQGENKRSLPSLGLCPLDQLAGI